MGEADRVTEFAVKLQEFLYAYSDRITVAELVGCLELAKGEFVVRTMIAGGLDVSGEARKGNGHG